MLCTVDKQLEPRSIRFDETSLESYGVDSLKLVQLASAVEERYGIEISDADAFEATSVAQLVYLIERKLSRASIRP